MTTRSRQRAFTLIELVAVMAIAAMVIASAGLMLRQVSAARSRIEDQSADDQQAISALRNIATAFANMDRSAGDNSRNDDPPIFEGVDEQFGADSADRVRFFTVSDRRIRADQPESDVHEVEYFLRRTNAGAAELVRRTDPTRNRQPDGGGVLEVLARNIVALNIEYHDGVRWRDDWPETLQQQPHIMRITLHVLTSGRRPQVRTFTHLVYLPYFQSTSTNSASPTGGAP